MRRTPAILLFVFCLASIPLAAQPVESPGTDALLRALIQEIRLLRVAIQRDVTAELRANILVERERRAAERVDQLAQQVEQNFPDERFMMEDFDMHVEQLRTRLRTETDPEQRRQVETELAMIDRRREMNELHREQMRVRKIETERRLEEERARLETLRSEIDVLLNELAENPPD